MAKTLNEYLEGRTCEGLTPRPQYFHDGDFVTYFFREDIAFEERVDELLTVYRSLETKELVGCKIKGVQRILGTLGDFGVIIKDDAVALGLLFLGAAMVKPENRPNYERVGKKFGGTPIPPQELPLLTTAA